MDLNLPFFGKKGSVKNILENEKTYTISYYGVSLKDDCVVSEIPKNEKNYNLLMEIYYNDLEEYLIINSSRYDSYKNSKFLEKGNADLINLLLILAVLLIGCSIPMILSFENLFLLGIGLDVLSIPVLVTSFGLYFKEIDSKKKEKFVENYRKLEYRYRLFKEDESKQNIKTKYVGLQKINSDDKVIDLRLIKELKKVS